MLDVDVMFCFDDRILTGAGVSILSMLDHADEDTRYRIHVMHPGLSKNIQSALLELVEGSRHKMNFYHIPASRFRDVPKNSGSWTEIVYYRLLASEILSGLSRVIYSDVDVFIKKDLASVFEIDLSDCEWGGVAAERNCPDAIMHKYFPENSKEFIYFSGFMVMNLDLMRGNDAVNRYFSGIEEFGRRLKFFDLDLLNICTTQVARVPFSYCVLETIYEANDVTSARDYGFLQSVYSVAELEAARDKPAIIHYAGKRGKPWQRRDVPTDFFSVERRLPKRLQRKTFRDFRKRWLSRKGQAHLMSRTPVERI
ncbi:glycosyltransferase family 8 protein [Sedimentimonas flavescens]|uniref:Glycosyltransferase family 8 protein n=1 Tax=Sedimentimonas flavescens TaxID=2851012 RepID=A0ABT2ZZN5_9RHOB|nr:glycosyltransferase family 8 protein [Sedimentimonas flavescens]MCV2879207.1 glycosyltransferase family 8 protein [Sedimentimonas flavescens]